MNTAVVELPLIETSGLGKDYNAGTTAIRALSGVNLTVMRGEMVAIVGASGSGKSTLMNILGCLDTPTSGAYALDGSRVDALSRNELAGIRNSSIGFVFQTPNMLPLTTALENVELPLLYDRSGAIRDTRAAAAMALNRVGLGNRSMHGSNELSGGELQRVSVARALVTRPSLLLADEPTGNLDTGASHEILDLLLQLHAEGTTVIIATHDKVMARCAQRIIELVDGEVVHDR